MHNFLVLLVLKCFNLFLSFNICHIRICFIRNRNPLGGVMIYANCESYFAIMWDGE